LQRKKIGGKVKVVLKKYGTLVLFSVLIFIALFFIYQKLNPKKLPSNLISATGRIDGDLINLNTKYSGRIKSIFVSDGQPIKKGDVIAILEDKEYQAKKQQIESQINMLKKQLKAHIYELEIEKKLVLHSIEKAKLNLKITYLNKQKLIDSFKELKLKTKQDKKDYIRYKNLFKNGAISKRKLELAKLQYDIDQKSLNTLNKELKTANKAIKIAQIALKDANASKKKIDALNSNIKAAQEQIKAYKASLGEIQAVLSEMVIKSPIDGYVVEKIANVGEVVSPGYTIATLIDPCSLYLKVFVDTIKNGKIKIGDKAEIFLDAYPNEPIPAKVAVIAQMAEFTPKEVNVRSDRIQRVYAVHLKPTKANPLLKLGIPAIGVISLDGKGLPHSLNEIPKL
jgi:HlyD family secretion protein